LGIVLSYFSAIFMNWNSEQIESLHICILLCSTCSVGINATRGKIWFVGLDPIFIGTRIHKWAVEGDGSGEPTVNRRAGIQVALTKTGLQ
jgi:hypothetical protein